VRNRKPFTKFALSGSSFKACDASEAGVSGVSRNFFRGGGGVQQGQLRTVGR
jgi:hypothetical protein